MALRLIEMVLPDKDAEEVQQLLKAYQVIEHRQVRLLDKEVLVRILLDAEQNDAVLDLLEKQYTDGDNDRAIILSVVATFPRSLPVLIKGSGKSSGQIGREESYEGVSKMQHNALGPIWQ